MQKKQILIWTIAGVLALAVLTAGILMAVFRHPAPEEPGTGTGEATEERSEPVSDAETEPGTAEEPSGETEPVSEQESESATDPETEPATGLAALFPDAASYGVTDAEIRDRILVLTCRTEGEAEMTREDLKDLMKLYLAVAELDPQDRYTRVSVTVRNAQGNTVYDDTRRLPVPDPGRMPIEEVNLETVRAGINDRVAAFFTYSCKEVSLGEFEGIPIVNVTIQSTNTMLLPVLLASGLTGNIVLDTLGYYEVAFSNVQLVDANSGEILVWVIAQEDWDLALIWLAPQFR